MTKLVKEVGAATAAVTKTAALWASRLRRSTSAQEAAAMQTQRAAEETERLCEILSMTTNAEINSLWR